MVKRVQIRVVIIVGTSRFWEEEPESFRSAFGLSNFKFHVAQPLNWRPLIDDPLQERLQLFKAVYVSFARIIEIQRIQYFSLYVYILMAIVAVHTQAMFGAGGKSSLSLSA